MSQVPHPPPPPGPQWGQGPPPQQQAWGQPPPQQPPSSPQQDKSVLSIIGLGLGITAFIFFPIILGPIGLILGAVGYTRGERLAVVAMIVSGVGTVVGSLIGIFMWELMYYY